MTTHPDNLTDGSQVIYRGRVATVTQVRFDCPILRCPVRRQSLAFDGDTSPTETVLALDPGFEGAAS